MKKQQKPMLTLEELSTSLDIYGADISRMPVELGEKVSCLIESDEKAKKIYKEAYALDKSLMQAENISETQISELEAKIMSAVAKEQSEDIPDNAKIIHLDLKNKKPPKPEQLPKFGSVANWAAPGLLAASLVFGMVLGGLGVTDGILSASQDIVTFNAELTDDIFSLGNENYFIEL